MAKSYFKNFPKVTYGNYEARDITVSAKLINKYSAFPYTFDYRDVEHNSRADQVSNEAYGDPFMSWLLYYSNGITDPYYDWYLTEPDFGNFLLKKYGSVEYTFRKILGFRTNWYSDDRELSPSQFLAMFGEYTDPHSSYWSRNYAPETGKVLSYTRKKYDSFSNTNKLVKVSTSNGSVSTGDLVNIYTGGVVTGNAEVQVANSTSVVIVNVLGSISNGSVLVDYSNSSSNSTITGYSTSSNTSLDEWTVTNIPANEYVYWEPYTVNDYENERNEANRKVNIVDPSTAVLIYDRLEEELSGR